MTRYLCRISRVVVSGCRYFSDMKNLGPIAARKEHRTEDGRIDYYHWLRDPKWPDVKNAEILNHLEQENDYFKANISEELTEKIFTEMKDKFEKSDRTVPFLDSGYYYYRYILEGQKYWIHARKRVGSDVEEVLLDENLLAADKKYCSVSEFEVSPDHKKVAYLADFDGYERYTVYVKDLESGEIIDSNVDNVKGGIEWDELNKGFFYTPSSEFWRTDRIFYHELSKPKKDDKLLYHDDDNTFSVYVTKSSSSDYIFFVSKSSIAAEYHFINSKSPFDTPKLIRSRSTNNLYSVEHYQDRFFIKINDVSSNFRVVETPVEEVDEKSWKEFVAPSDVYIKYMYAYESHLVLLNRVNGLAQIEIYNLKGGSRQKIHIEDESYEVYIQRNTFHDKALRYVYSSLKTPKTTIDHDFATGEKTILKTQVIPSGFEPSKYVLRRIWATTDDNVNVPISVLYNKELAKLDGTDPLYLYGYGSYGHASSDSFMPFIFPLVDRGFCFAIAHIRGGDEMGKAWHESARFLCKKNTFTDFIRCAEKLIEDKYTGEGKIVISGRSAGGLLIGSCINERPKLFKAAVTHVPFVDVLSTMLDDSLPLTPGEYKEWGNPKEKDYYDYIKSYSPYDNVVPQDYPHLFVLAGLTDPRVTYWEPAKWVALLRHTKTDDNLIVFKTDMDCGHMGPTGRFEYLKDFAMEFVFILQVFGKAK